MKEEKSNQNNAAMNIPEKSGMTQKSASMISLKYRRIYQSFMLIFAFIGVALVTLFLFYDELDMRWMIISFAIIFFIGLGLLVIFNKRKYHEKFINYRLLSEILRIQEVLNAAGIQKNAADYLPWTMKEMILWLRERMDGSPCNDNWLTISDLRGKWLKDQYEYHIAADQKVLTKMKKNSFIYRLATVLSCVVIFSAVLYELYEVDINIEFGGMSLKSWILLLYGLLSAIVLFLSEYYGKQALERKHEDHVHMAELYQYALEVTEKQPITPEQVEFIAREEVLANGNWYSYMKENTPSVSILH